MHIYLTNINLAIMAFLFLFVLSILPFVLYFYKKYGHFGGVRAGAIYLFIFAMLAAFFMVIFPLPEVTEGFCAKRAANTIPNFEPFRFLKDISKELHGDISLIGVLKSRTFMVTAFNVLLLMPLGFFLRYLFDFKWYQVLIAGFLTSLFFEVTQLTGNFGFYECPYRLFEVDDLITNTTGAMLGFWMFKYFRFLPSTKVEHELPHKKANLTERFLMVMVDYLFILFIAENFLIPHSANLLWHLTYLLFIFFLYFVVMQAKKIKTVGGKLFGLKLVEGSKDASFKSIFIYYGVLIFTPTIISELTKYLVRSQKNNGIIAVSGMTMLLVWAVLIFGLPLFRRDRKGLQNILSNVEIVKR